MCVFRAWEGSIAAMLVKTGVVVLGIRALRLAQYVVECEKLHLFILRTTPPPPAPVESKDICYTI